MNNPNPSPADTLVAWVIPLVFLAVAAWFVLGHRAPDIPVQPINVVPAESFAPEPWRDPQTLPQYQTGGFETNCNACHRLFESKTETPTNLTQHTDITFDHGMNNRCFNCHHRENREALVLYTGEQIPFHDTVRLCAQCHGPTFRDWERGVHGKTMGYWNEELGTVTKLTCVQCHDPHAPAFPDMHPLPGPDTLRMGDPHAHHAEHDGHADNEKHNPLKIGESH